MGLFWKKDKNDNLEPKIHYYCYSCGDLTEHTLYTDDFSNRINKCNQCQTSYDYNPSPSGTFNANSSGVI